jgi:hypothetical protein
VTDTNGKQHKVTEWKWLAGTKRLGWLAPDKGEPEKDNGKAKDNGKGKKGKQPAATGPEAFVFRDATTINFLAGVQTLIPLDRLRSLTFDNDKKLLTVTAAADGDKDASMEGTTRYTNINWFSLEADVDRGDEGVASFRFLGGSSKGNVKSVRFPSTKVEPIKGDRPAVVQTIDKSTKQEHKVSDLVALYSVGGREKLSPILMFRKTLKLDVHKIKSITNASDDSEDVSWQVTRAGSEDSTLTLLERGTLDGQPAQLLGLVGKVPVGFKFFPVRRVASIHFDAAEAPKENLLPDPDVEKTEKKDD